MIFFTKIWKYEYIDNYRAFNNTSNPPTLALEKFPKIRVLYTEIYGTYLKTIINYFLNLHNKNDTLEIFSLLLLRFYICIVGHRTNGCISDF